MAARYQATFTVTADTQDEFDAHKASVLAHPLVVAESLVEDGLSFSFTYDANVDE